ncbi:MAG TPA: sigma-70 family RNA polymerase sigma factor [Ktedonosporobacter sp.]|jgi:RNA polymerase sigma factor (sigma-70 family)|nr:sigma-70 family RNA polymerase sigma factor [Ktedonosporobacter sp.]
MNWPDKDDRSVVAEMQQDPQSPEWQKCRAFFIKKYMKKGYPDPIKEDVVQEALIKVLKCLGTFSYKYPLVVWLGIIFTSTAIDFFRKERRERANISLNVLQDASEEELEVAIETRTPEDAVIIREEIHEVITGYHKALEGRRNGKRDFYVWSRVLLGQEVRQIADHLKIDRQTIYRIIREAKQYFSQLRHKD